jgi:hypothetical protein
MALIRKKTKKSIFEECNMAAYDDVVVVGGFIAFFLFFSECS